MFYLNHARRTQELALFTRQLAGAMKARVPLAEVVSSFSHEAETREMQRALRAIGPRLQAGEALSAALAENPGTFPESYRRVIQMGEESQTLPEVTANLATSLEESVWLSEHFRRAAIYPAIVLSLLFLVLLFYGAMVLPKFQDIYNQLGGGLPFRDERMISLVAVTGILLCVLWVIAAGAGVAWASYRHGKWVLSLPIVGGAMRLAETARFLNHLGLMLRHRIPMNEAVGLLADSTTNGYTRAALLDFEQRLTRGESLGTLVGKQPIFPPTLAVMISSAQERGQLDETLIELSAYYRQRADHALRVLREFFEPVMLVVAGVVVIWISVSMYLPMFNIPRMVM